MSEIKTPYFLIDTAKIDELVNNTFSAINKKWQNAIIGYSFKTNNLPWIISYMKDKGLWAEVVSSDEYCLAKALGFEPSKIIFNGPVKEKKEFIEAIENNAIVNIDAKRELLWLLECDKESLKNAKIGLRVNFCIEEFCPSESQCGAEDGRFGFSYEQGELSKAINFLKEHNISLSGLHMHCSSKTRSLNIYQALSKMAVNIVEEFSLDLKFLDIGGGYFGGVPGKPSFEEYANIIYSITSKCDRLKMCNLIIEPGISVIGAAVDYVTSIIDIKETKNNRFVVTDGSRMHIDPQKRKTQYTYRIEHRKEQDEKKNHKPQILCGFTCMEDDRFFSTSENFTIGDNVIFEKVGAYTMGLSSQFINFYPIVCAKINDEIVVVRRKNSAEDFIAISCAKYENDLGETK